MTWRKLDPIIEVDFLFLRLDFLKKKINMYYGLRMKLDW